MNDNEDIESTKTSSVEPVPEKGSPLTGWDLPDGADERARDHNPLAPPINFEPGS
jgi:hypothetical protein